ncbi:MAG: metal-dependent hydrolase [Planctomycetales bacterium]|nr:metal-dependent hydrolase [Planctomycetales bacterium]
MSTELTWLGHSCFAICTEGCNLLVDPFLDDSPTAPLKADEIAADFVLLTHGHFDHVADAAAIATRTGATVVANFEIGEWLKGQGVAEENVVAMNTGGSAELAFGRAKMTLAHHSSGLPDGSYGGSAGGYILDLKGKRVYLAGDTSLFLDMKLYGMTGLDLAVLPIGDLFTMGPDDSIEAIKMLNPRQVVPCHYGTWPPISQDASAWADRVRSHTAAEPVVLAPGEKLRL